ncbi:Ig-like domain-containing protein [Priestia aryabhattai]|uniref:Ig-like domain-containing protein n=1 Tax=Priestia aryabhattai TaxID=412384 RepID=UPI00203B849A|nr:Ig-like domain-containing protein [Priestia aryabhattai]MCM3255582.1 Ig-like domain-containing protein [Priestia aryabhattai]
MKKKGIISLLSVGLLASSLSVGTAQAEGNNYEASKKAIESQLKNDKPLNHNVISPSVLNDFKEKTLNSLKTPKSFSAKKSNAASISGSPMYESEPNDDFKIADTLLNDRMTFGQFDDTFDIDFYKVYVSGKGTLLVGGVTDTPSDIDLLFVATEYDYQDHGYLEYLDSEYDDGVEVQEYKVNKAGTYYIPVLDLNSSETGDVYGISTLFQAEAKDTVAPNKPTVNKVDNNDKVVTGKAEAGSTVTVNVGKSRIGYAKASSNGSLSVNIPVQKAGTSLNVTAKDASGNVSKLTYVTVVKADVTPPNKPTVNKVDDNDKVVTGKAEANSTVTVNVGKNRIGYAKTNSKGSFSVSIPVQKKGTTLNVTAKDASNNVSKLTYVTVAKH